ncbi:MAG: hypothetical protein EOR23_34225 [Mesorhizobium sp.]|nr:MAG: hypothetical protein EOR23_34225 [Mesorhizobium sp.]
MRPSRLRRHRPSPQRLSRPSAPLPIRRARPRRSRPLPSPPCRPVPMSSTWCRPLPSRPVSARRWRPAIIFRARMRAARATAFRRWSIRCSTRCRPVSTFR